MKLSREEKLKLMRSLNWDYTTTPEDMLAVVEGELDKAGPFDKTFLFVRSLQRLPSDIDKIVFDMMSVSSGS